MYALRCVMPFLITSNFEAHMCSRFQYSIPKGETLPQWRRQRGIMPLNPVVLTSIIRTSDISNPEVGYQFSACMCASALFIAGGVSTISSRHSSCLSLSLNFLDRTTRSGMGRREIRGMHHAALTNMSVLAGHSHESRDAIHLHARYDDRLPHKVGGYRRTHKLHFHIAD